MTINVTINGCWHSENQFDEKKQDWLVLKFLQVPGVEAVERGRKIREEKKLRENPPRPFSRWTIILFRSPPSDYRALQFERLEQAKKVGLWRLQSFDASPHFSSSHNGTTETWLLVVLRITILGGLTSWYSCFVNQVPLILVFTFSIAWEALKTCCKLRQRH